MKFKSGQTIAAIFFSLLVSCVGNKGETAVETENLTSEIFVKSDNLVMPSFMSAAGDGLLVTNMSKADTLLNYYNRDGLPAGAFLPNGEGDKEALWLRTIQYDANTGDAYCSDIDKNVLFRISGVTSGRSAVSKVFSRPSSEGDSLQIPGKYLWFKNFIIGYNASMAGMFAVFSPDGKLIGTAVQYPDKSLVDDGLTEWANIQLYQPNLSVNDKGDFGVVTFSDSGMMVLISDNDGKPDFKIIDGAAPNDIFLVQSGPDFVQGARTKDSRTHAISSSAGREHAYVLYSGKTSEELYDSEYYKTAHLYGSPEVKVYDKDGKEVRRLHLDRWVHQIAVSPDENWLYAITDTPNDGEIIVRYGL